MSKPLVSVIVTTYNYSHYIRDALHSALSQTYPRFEIIVIDDGSKDVDETRRIVLELSDPRITLIAKPSNQGISKARNEGLKQASGKYLTFLDADDIFMPDKLRTQVDLLERNPQYVMAYSDEYLFGDDGVVQSIPVQAGHNGVLPSGYVAAEFVKKSFVALFTVLLCRSAVERVGPFDPTLPQNEDDDLWLRVMLDGPVIFSPYVSGARRVHPTNTSKNRHIMVTSQSATFSKLARQHPEFVQENRRIIRQRIRKLALRYVMGQIKRGKQIQLSVLKACADTYISIGKTRASHDSR